MRNFFVFDGKPSTDFETYIASSDMFDAPERDMTVISVPGRSGDLSIDNGRFQNGSRTIQAYIPKDMRTNLDGLRRWLLSKTGYCRYEEAERPQEYKKALFQGPFTVGTSDRVGAELQLTFNCMPQRFLKSGEIPHTFLGSGSIWNNTEFPAKPLIRVYGTGVLGIGSETITITSNPGYIDIDCEMMDAYYGGTNCNGMITLSSGEFPVLESGNNGVSLGNGITQVVITPHWWTI